LFDWQSHPISKLSLGQRSRVALLGLRFAEPNFYLLDEPTNHVDIAGQETLAEEIRERGASCILVSHDRSFVRDVGTRFFVIERGKLTEVETSEAYFSTLN
jgi:ATPase subunit of ABC transporter with duplicated ATPase domains